MHMLPKHVILDRELYSMLALACSHPYVCVLVLADQVYYISCFYYVRILVN